VVHILVLMVLGIVDNYINIENGLNLGNANSKNNISRQQRPNVTAGLPLTGGIMPPEATLQFGTNNELETGVFINRDAVNITSDAGNYGVIIGNRGFSYHRDDGNGRLYYNGDATPIPVLGFNEKR
jgi:hypothetical protein